MTFETVIYRRDKLYEQVWSKPVREVAKEYGVSDVALAKVCRRMGVPLPGRGHWARIVAGQKIRRSPLLPPKKGEPAELRVQRRQLPAGREELREAVKQRLADQQPPRAQVLIDPSLDDPHPLVAATAKVLRKRKPDPDGVARCLDQQCLAIQVAPPLLDRALRIMNALLKALGARGVEVDVTEPEPCRIWTPTVSIEQVTMPVTRARIDDEWIPFIIDEGTDTIDWLRADPPQYQRARYEHRPNGQLRLRIQVELDGSRIELPRSRWCDGAKRHVEDWLDAFIQGLFVAAVSLKAARVEAETRRREQEDRERQLRLERERRELEAQRQKQLDEDLPRWRRARDIREFVAEMRRIVRDGGCNITPGGELDEWLRWCDVRAEQLDPLTSLRKNVEDVKRRRAANEASTQMPSATCDRSDAGVPGAAPRPT
jgi:hypothetical protein